MKELSRTELSSVRRINSIVKNFLSKRERLLKKVAELEEEVNSIDSQIESFEKPIQEITEGYTSTEYLDILLQKDIKEEPQVSGINEIDL